MREFRGSGLSVRAGRLLRACLWLLATAPAWAISPDKPIEQHVYEFWTADHGLPQNSVNAIAQTPDGFLWVGTYEGLVRFDGSRIEGLSPSLADLTGDAISGLWVGPDGALWVASLDNGVSRIAGTGPATRWSVADGLPGEAALAVHGRSADDIWIGTTEGVARLVDGKLERIPGVPAVPVRDIAFDGQGRVWLATRSPVVYVVEGTVVHELTLTDEASAISLFGAADGTIWIGSTRGLHHYDDRRLVRRYTREDGLASMIVTKILVDDAGDVWLGYEGEGIQRLHAGKIESFNVERGLHSNFIRTLAQDAHGNVWVGTTSGLGRLRDGLVVSYGRRQGLRSEFMRSVAEGRDGTIWFGSDGGGLGRIDDSGVRNFGLGDGILGDTVRSIAIGPDDEVWFSVYGRGLQRLHRGSLSSWRMADGLPSALIRSLVANEDGSLWIATEDRGLILMRDGVFTVYDRSAGLPSDDIRSLLKTRDGTLYAGTYDAGIVAFRDFQLAGVVDVGQGLPSARIFALYEDDRGHLWIGSQLGLGRYDGRQYLDLRQVGSNFGRAVFFITQDKRGGLWFSGNRGITHVPGDVVASLGTEPPRQLQHQLINRYDGLLSQQINGGSQPAGARGRDGLLWFPTAAGVAVIDPDRIGAAESLPRVRIESVAVHGQPVSLPADGRLLLEPGQNRIEIHYAGVHDLIPGSPFYQTRLEGLDSEDAWSPRHFQRSAWYAALPPGDYTFRVRAVSPRGATSAEDAVLRFHIQPRFYQRAGYQAAGILGLLALGGGIAAIRTNQLRRINRYLERKVAQRTSEIDEKNRELQAAFDEVQRLSHTDPLTGLYNRRFLYDIIASDVSQTLRRYQKQMTLPPDQRECMAVLMVDIDYFKSINDEYGHAVGDDVLRMVADTLRKAVRASEHIVRWGGEEFLIVARGLRAGEASILAQRIVDSMPQTTVDAGGLPLRCTCSVGLAYFPFFPAAPQLASWEDVAAIADLALYVAKQKGRDGWVALSARADSTDPDLVRRLIRDPEHTLSSDEILIQSSLAQRGGAGFGTPGESPVAPIADA